MEDVKAPIDAMHQGMAYCPEDRKVEGIIADLSVRENMILALQAKRGMFKLMSRKEQEELTDKYIKMLQVKTASRETPIKSLSGGNQQKVILGRWLMTEPDFLILDEPTRGIDVGTKTEIQKLVVKLANEGMSVVFISSEVEEMLRTVTHIGITMKTSTVKLEMKTVYATVAAIAVYMVCFALYQKKIFRKKIFTTLICFLFIVETAAMAVMGFQENGTVDTDSYFQDTKAITEVKKEYQKNVETRMELISGRMLDESIWHTLNGMTLFGSTAQGNVVDMMDQLGFYTGVNEYLYEGATPFTNNLMSMKYQIYRPYDTKYTEFSLKESVGNVTVYKNPYRTALAYTMDDLVQTWDYEDYNPFYVQNDLATSAFDVDELFHMVKTAKPQLNDCKITSDNGDGEYVFENTSARPDNMVFTIRSTKTRRLYIHFDGSQVENTVIEKNGEQVLTGRLDSQIIYLGNVQKGDEIRIKMQLKQDNEMSGVVRLTAAELDEEVMEELAQRMQENAWKLTSAKGNHLSGTIHAQEDQMLFFSIPYDKGWTVKIDGKKVKTKALGKAFLTVKVPEGKHKVSLT